MSRNLLFIHIFHCIINNKHFYFNIKYFLSLEGATFISLLIYLFSYFLFSLSKGTYQLLYYC